MAVTRRRFVAVAAGSVAAAAGAVVVWPRGRGARRTPPSTTSPSSASAAGSSSSTTPTVPLEPDAAPLVDARSPLDLTQIQGNVLAGFRKDHAVFVFARFDSAAGARAWLRALLPFVSATSTVATFNDAFRAAVTHGTPRPRATWVNVAFSWEGLRALGRPADELARFPDEFRAGMRARAVFVGDVGPSAPDHWPAPLRDEAHVVLTIAADDADDRTRALLDHLARMNAHGVRETWVQFGDARSDEPGHEHFGYRDGISQPGVRGFTRPADPNRPDQGDPGQDLLWPGEFVVGHVGQAGPEAFSAVAPDPEWTRDGSYMVIRRLRQDVAGFRNFVDSVAAAQGIDHDAAGALVFGRFRSGAPLATAPDPRRDPALDDPAVLRRNRINDFDYADDPDGRRVPLAAHVRKGYARATQTREGGEEATQHHRLLRRGIPFGQSLPAGASDDGAVFPDDRGLVFVCFQSSIANQFEWVQRRWMNNPDFPRTGAGQDAVVANDARLAGFAVPGGRQEHIDVMTRFVVTTGGGYFFAPSIAALGLLGAS